MPEVFRKNGLIFFFYSEEHAPKHIHVKGKGGTAKYSTEGKIELVFLKGYSKNDAKLIKKTV